MIERKFVTLGIYWFLVILSSNLTADPSNNFYLTLTVSLVFSAMHVFFPNAYHRYYTGTDDPLTATFLFRLFQGMIGLLIVVHGSLLLRYIDMRKTLERGVIPLEDPPVLPPVIFVVVFAIYVLSCWRATENKGSGRERILHTIGVFYWPIGLIFMKRR